MSSLYVLPNEDSIDSVSSSVLSSSASTSTTASARTRKESKNYYLSSIHDNYEEAVKVVEQEMLWRKSNKTKSTQYYKCNRVKCRDKNQCASALYIYKDPESQKASIYATICPHTHAQVIKSVTTETRSYIETLIKNQNLKPNVILEAIERDKDKLNLQVPKKKDLYNFLYTLLKKKVGKSNMTIGELAKFCEDHSQVPEEDHEPFILDYQIFDHDDTETLVDYEEGDQFRVVMSTKFLLKFSVHFKLVLQTDGTYKLVWQGAFGIWRVTMPEGMYGYSYMKYEHYEQYGYMKIGNLVFVHALRFTKSIYASI